MSPAKLDQGAATADDNDNNDSDNSKKRSSNSNSSSSKSRERSGDSSNETITTTTTGSAVRGASLLIVLQIASRALTFLANQLLLRFLTAQLLGVSTQLEVYYLSVLFFARESLRVAIQRHQSSSSASAARDSQSVVNLAYLSLLLGLGVAAALGAAYLRYVDAATAASTPYLDVALYIYAAAALIELLSEPAFVVLQYRLRFGPRAAAESLATLLRCLVTLGAASWAWTRRLELGVLPFALGQLAYGAGLLAVYAGYGFRLAAAEGFSLFPRRATIAATTTADEKKNDDDDDDASSYVLGYFYRPTLHLASSLMSQSFVKHLLTQGDTFLVSALSDPASQGVYALANNYGGLLARLVFQPVEESSRNYFSKLLSSSSSSSSSSALARARSDLQSLLRFYLLLGLVVVSAGPFAAPLLVQLVAGPRWSASGAGAVLARYCLYVPLLAVNGAAEAFVSSVAAAPDVRRQSLWMAAFSCAFAAAGFVALRVLRLGAAGLVYANAVNMLCRIAWSAAFISRYFATNEKKNDKAGVGFGWDAVVPRALPLYVLATAVLWSALSRAGIEVGGVSTHVFKDLFTVAAGAVPYVILIAYAERQYLLDSYRSIRGGKS
ncbi:Rft-1-domain-containing protein [Biscogniauxia mediterranea]|nr:Rft-1-domain-containing protein [Biscogniauxia mediterranea]